MIIVLHIINDNKFIDNCKRLFTIDNVKNIFIKSGEIRNDFIEENKIDVVCVHYLRSYEAKFIRNYEGDVKFIWFFWGGDGFSLGKFYKYFLLPKTLRVEKKIAFKTSTRRVLKYVAKYYFPNLIDFVGSRFNIIKSINKFDYIVPVVPGDYYLLKKMYKVDAKMYHINYVSSFNENSENKSNFTQESNNILIGNSSSSANNHLEIIDIVKKCKLSDNVKIVLPLNYGDVVYGNYVSEYAKKALQNNCLILRDFMSFDEYSNILNSCEFVVMNHLRQQGLGNIIIAIINRKTLYLQKESTIYKYLTENQFYVSNVDSLKREGFIKLSDKHKEINYNLAISYFGEKTNIDKTKHLLFEML